MVVYACFLASLFGAAVAGAAEKPPTQQLAPRVATDQVLMDIEQVGVVVVTDAAELVEPWPDVARLQVQIVERLVAGGIKRLEKETGRGPTLVVQVEGKAVPGSDKYVYRVQTSLDRPVLLPSRKNLRIQARVWQVRPALAVVAQAEAGNAIATAALAQAQSFVGECKAARDRLKLTEGAGQNASAPQSGGVTQPNAQNLQAASTYPFLASQSGSVFHRPDCRWAQNITGANLVGYKDREEAVQAGKRPCKSCKP